MNTYPLDRSKALTKLVLLGLALLVTGWMLARSRPATATPQTQSTPSTAGQNLLVQRVKDALANESTLKAEQIEVVSAKGGKVQLNGTLNTSSKRQLAFQVAEKTAGKAKVINKIIIGCPKGSCEPQVCCCWGRPRPIECECRDICDPPWKPKKP